MKDLLISLRNQIEVHTFLSHVDHPEQGVGLCHIITNGNFVDIEKMSLRSYVYKNRPKDGEPHFDPSMQYEDWYWECGAVAPRVAWLNDEIAKFN